MGTKRPHYDKSMPPESASRPISNHPSKRRKPNDFAPPATKSASVNQLKSKIRDLARALEHSDHLPAGVRIEKERALAGYKQDVEKIHEDKRRNELIKRYHMVRFFGGSFLALDKLCSVWTSNVLITTIFKERQKATRAHKRLKKRLDASSPDTSEYKQLEKELHDAEIDVNYTIYYPLTEKYQSLFPRQGDAGGGETATRKLVAGKPAMWKMVERCSADGTLDTLRDGKLETSIPVGKRRPAPEKLRSNQERKDGGTGSKSAKGAAPLEQDEDEDGDGGFFEE